MMTSIRKRIMMTSLLIKGVPCRTAMREIDRRVVITGMGLASPLACGVRLAWRRLLDGQSGVRPLPDEVCLDLSSRIAGLVPRFEDDPEGGLNVERVVPFKELKKMDRFIQLALVAADEAVSQAKLGQLSEEQAARAATIIASGVGGFPVIADAVRTAQERGLRRLSPFTVPAFLVNLAAGQISIRYGLTGPIGAPATACAASLQAIGDAARLIRCGEADMAICGGAESTIDAVAVGSFAAAKALSASFNDRPELCSRPFDQTRDGFVIGEGAAILVIEELSHAMARGAIPLAEVTGYGTTADAFHVTAGPEDGRGARAAMAQSLRQASLEPSDIQYLSAHATSTPVGDAAELRAITDLFGRTGGTSISSVKGATGHLLGAAGGMAAIFGVLAIQDQVVPMTLNLSAPDPFAEGLDLVMSQPRSRQVKNVLVNGFGFGGVNASVILSAIR